MVRVSFLLAIYLSLSRNTIKEYIFLFELLSLGFEAIDAKTDAELEVLFSQISSRFYISYTQKDF